MAKITVNEAGTKVGKWSGEIPVGSTAIARYRITNSSYGEVQMRLNDATLGKIEASGALYSTPHSRVQADIRLTEDNIAEHIAGKMRGCVLNLLTNLMSIGKGSWFDIKSGAAFSNTVLPVFEDMAKPSVYVDGAEKIWAELESNLPKQV